MTTRKAFAVFSAVTFGIVNALFLLVYLSSANPISDFALSEQVQIEAFVDGSGSVTQPYSITFPSGDWPWYAQNEISVFPEPPVAGQPTELCAEVVNTDPLEPHVAILEFRIAEFGIGMFAAPVGAAEVYVPPQGAARGCTIWVPTDSTRVGLEVVLMQEGFAPQIS
jgi:hypothetical protein